MHDSNTNQYNNGHTLYRLTRFTYVHTFWCIVMIFKVLYRLTSVVNFTPNRNPNSHPNPAFTTKPNHTSDSLAENIGFFWEYVITL